MFDTATFHAAAGAAAPAILLAHATHTATTVPSAPVIPTGQLAQSEPKWIAGLWIAGMLVLVGLVVWMAVTGRLFRRHRHEGG